MRLIAPISANLVICVMLLFWMQSSFTSCLARSSSRLGSSALFVLVTFQPRSQLLPASCTAETQSPDWSLTQNRLKRHFYCLNVTQLQILCCCLAQWCLVRLEINGKIDQIFFIYVLNILKNKYKAIYFSLEKKHHVINFRDMTSICASLWFLHRRTAGFSDRFWIIVSL